MEIGKHDRQESGNVNSSIGSSYNEHTRHPLEYASAQDIEERVLEKDAIGISRMCDRKKIHIRVVV